MQITEQTAAVGPQDAPSRAGRVVRRVLLRRNIVIDAETAQLVAAAGDGNRHVPQGVRSSPHAAGRP